jgi:hypothetical protein
MNLGRGGPTEAARLPLRPGGWHNPVPELALLITRRYDIPPLTVQGNEGISGPQAWVAAAVSEVRKKEVVIPVPESRFRSMTAP